MRLYNNLQQYSGGNVFMRQQISADDNVPIYNVINNFSAITITESPLPIFRVYLRGSSALHTLSYASNKNRVQIDTHAVRRKVIVWLAQHVSGAHHAWIFFFMAEKLLITL